MSVQIEQTTIACVATSSIVASYCIVDTVMSKHSLPMIDVLEEQATHFPDTTNNG